MLACSLLGAQWQQQGCCIEKWERRHSVTLITVCQRCLWAGCSLLFLRCCFSESIEATENCNHTKKPSRLVWVTAEVRNPNRAYRCGSGAALVPAPLPLRPLNPAIHTPLAAPLLIPPLIRGHNNSQPPPSSSVLCNFIQNSEVWSGCNSPALNSLCRKSAGKERRHWPGCCGIDLCCEMASQIFACGGIMSPAFNH